MKKTSNAQRPTPNVEQFRLELRLARALERIATSLETVIDRRKRTVRIVDVERGKVYKTHLGKNLRKSADKKGAAK